MPALHVQVTDTWRDSGTGDRNSVCWVCMQYVHTAWIYFSFFLPKFAPRVLRELEEETVGELCYISGQHREQQTMAQTSQSQESHASQTEGHWIVRPYSWGSTRTIKRKIHRYIRIKHLGLRRQQNGQSALWTSKRTCVQTPSGTWNWNTVVCACNLNNDCGDWSGQEDPGACWRASLTKLFGHC